jgi:hypothetical protein
MLPDAFDGAGSRPNHIKPQSVPIQRTPITLDDSEQTSAILHGIQRTIVCPMASFYPTKQRNNSAAGEPALTLAVFQ